MSEFFYNRLQQHFGNRFADADQRYCSPVSVQPLVQPQWVSCNPLLAEELGVEAQQVASDGFLNVITGGGQSADQKPIALVYSGHQFGVWAGQLGDGRVLTLGELAVGDKGELWDIQLKGAGTTPYSRFADGRAVLRSSIREYLGSEAVHGLGIPTTRALCLATSQTPVYREEVETAAVLCRVARSHIRFGGFEHFHYRGDTSGVKALADYVIERHFPAWVGEPQRYRLLLENAVVKTAQMIARWQSVGFCHGVMNTDNMSILGDTLDYGPFAFLDSYDPDFICNHSDTGGRYSFKNQPAVGMWNLNALATAFTSLLESEEIVACLKQYEPEFLTCYRQLMAAKLGLEDFQDGDEQLINDLLSLMAKDRVDYSIFFRKLCNFSSQDNSVRDNFIHRDQFDDWAEKYSQRLAAQDLDDSQRSATMRSINPKYVLRNYMAQIAIEKAENGDYSEVERLLRIMQSPFEEHPNASEYAGHPPDWAAEIAISCSS